MTYIADRTVAAERIARGNWNFTDDTGAAQAYTIFTVTGRVELIVFGICNIALTSGGAATIELGVAGNTAVFVAQTTGTALIANEIWQDSTPTTTVEAIDLAGTKTFIVTNSQNVIFTIGTTTLTAGDIDFYALWRPLSSTANVVAV